MQKIVFLQLPSQIAAFLRKQHLARANTEGILAQSSVGPRLKSGGGDNLHSLTSWPKKKVRDIIFDRILSWLSGPQLQALQLHNTHNTQKRGAYCFKIFVYVLRMKNMRHFWFLLGSFLEEGTIHPQTMGAHHPREDGSFSHGR